jgi:hypothetical protein
MDKITAAIGLIREASREMEKNGLTLEWHLEIKPYIDLFTPMLAKSKPQESTGAETELAEAAGLPQRLLGMTIRELVEKFHDLDGIERYVKMLHDLVEADEKDQRVQERRSNIYDGLMDFIEKRTAFEPEALVKLEELYTAYLDHHGFDRNDAACGEMLSRHRFTRWILETYSQFVSQRIARIDGKPARCFSGLKLRSLEELAETGTAQEVKA